jgi:hypothetical protein
MLVLIQVSSMKTSRRGSSPACQGSPALTPARDVGAGLLKSEQGFFEPQSLALHELPNRIVQDHDAACCQFVLQPVQRQVGRLSDPLHDEGAMQRSGYPMLASSPGSIFDHNFNQTGIPSDSLKP